MTCFSCSFCFSLIQNKEMLQGKMAKGSKRTAIPERRSSGTISLPAPSPHLLCRNHNDLAGDTLPAPAVPDPGVKETVPLGAAFSFLRFSDAKDAHRDGRVAVDFGADILVSCFAG